MLKKTMPTAIFLLCIFLLLPLGVFAADYPLCDCKEEHCTCFIQLGDEGPIVRSIIRLLIEQKYCPEDQKLSVFDEGAQNGVLLLQRKHDLPQTGMLDDDTLTLLIWGCLPKELNEIEPGSRYDYNWVPTDGGIRRHKKPDCCNMYDPRKVSVRNAEFLEYKNCGLCNKLDTPIE